MLPVSGLDLTSDSLMKPHTSCVPLRALGQTYTTMSGFVPACIEPGAN